MKEKSEIKITIAGICSLIKSYDKEFISWLKKRYSLFLSEKNPDIVIDVEIKDKIRNESTEFQIVNKKNQVFIEDRGFKGSINLNKKSGELLLKKSHIGNFGMFFRACYSLLLISYKGFLIHAAGIIHNNNGYVFTGRSGSGKSTVAKLSNTEDFTILSDELVFVKKVEDKYRVFGTPFIGEIEKCKDANAELKGIFILKKDKILKFQKITGSYAVLKLLSTVIFCSNNPVITQMLFTTVCDLLEKVPCYEMYFPKNKSFWKGVYSIC